MGALFIFSHSQAGYNQGYDRRSGITGESTGRLAGRQADALRLHSAIYRRLIALGE
jgi:hypothetical protein